LTVAAHAPAGAFTVTFDGHVIDGAGFDAAVVVEGLLFVPTGSIVELVTDAASMRDALFARLQFAVATIVIVAVAPAARVVKLTVRLLPVPPHVPPASFMQLTKVVPAGSVFVTTTLCASDGPGFVSVIV
jgi:hypothetical protein